MGSCLLTRWAAGVDPVHPPRLMATSRAHSNSLAVVASDSGGFGHHLPFSSSYVPYLPGENDEP
jgi:hypothetical protein